jgi:hypothetical protein
MELSNSHTPAGHNDLSPVGLLSLFCSSRYQQFFVQGKEEKERTRST